MTTSITKSHLGVKASAIRKKLVSKGIRLKKHHSDMLEAINNYEDTSKQHLQELADKVRDLESDVKQALSEFKRYDELFLGLPNPCSQATQSCSVTKYVGWTNSVLRVNQKILQDQQDKQ